MAKKFSTFWIELCQKAGLDPNNKSVKMIGDMAELQTTEVPDDILPQLEKNLHTEASALAKNEAALKKEVYDGIDAELERIYGELGIDDSVKTELNKEKSTNKRIGLLTKKIKEIEGKKTGAHGSDKEKLQDQINALKQERADEINKLKSDFDTERAGLNDEITSERLRSMVSGYKFALPDEMETDLKLDMALSAINKDLAKDGNKIIRNGKILKLVDSNGTEVFDKDNNVKLEVKSYMEQSLARNSLLKKSDSENQNDTDPKIIKNDGGGKQIDQTALGSIESQLKGLQIQSN